VLKHWQIYFLVLLFSARPLLGVIIKLPSIVTLLSSLLALGWLGTRFEFIRDAYEKNKLPWNQFGNLLIKYIKKLFPAALLITLLVVAVFIFIIIFYGKWYFGNVPFGQETQMTKQQLTEMFNSLNNPQNIQKFIGQFGILVFVGGLIFTMFSIILTIQLTILVIEDAGIIESLKKTLKFIKNNLLLFGAILILDIILGQINGQIYSFISSAILPSLQVNAILTFLISTPKRLVDLLMEAAIVIYYLETNKHSVGKIT